MKDATAISTSQNPKVPPPTKLLHLDSPPTGLHPPVSTTTLTCRAQWLAKQPFTCRSCLVGNNGCFSRSCRDPQPWLYKQRTGGPVCRRKNSWFFMPKFSRVSRFRCCSVVSMLFQCSVIAMLFQCSVISMLRLICSVLNVIDPSALSPKCYLHK